MRRAGYIDQASRTCACEPRWALRHIRSVTRGAQRARAVTSDRGGTGELARGRVGALGAPWDHPYARGMVAIGLVPHTGWTWLVCVAGSRAAPRVERRERVVACEVLEGQLYHLAAERSRDRERFVATRRAAAVQRARAALRDPLAGVRAAIVLGKQLALAPVDRIVAAHPMIHGAEGELWRAIFAEACAEAGIAVTRAEAGEIRALLGKRHPPAAIAAFLDDGKRTCGAPWSREPQDAALGAWSVL